MWNVAGMHPLALRLLPFDQEVAAPRATLVIVARKNLRFAGKHQVAFLDDVCRGHRVIREIGKVVLYAGRWASLRTLQHYIQEAADAQTLVRLEVETRVIVQTLPRHMQFIDAVPPTRRMAVFSNSALPDCGFICFCVVSCSF